MSRREFDSMIALQGLRVASQSHVARRPAIGVGSKSEPHLTLDSIVEGADDARGLYTVPRSKASVRRGLNALVEDGLALLTPGPRGKLMWKLTRKGRDAAGG